MLLGILSDTHGDVPRTQAAVEIFRRKEVQEVVHCGDVGSREVVKLLSEFRTHYVHGNTDSRGSLRKAILECGQTYYESVGILVREGKQIAFLHGDDWRTYGELLHSQRFDLICSGHTHQFEWQMEGKTYLLNPGALHRTPSPSVAILELPAMRVCREMIKTGYYPSPT
ncbi:MAG: metallophosphoesterase family protein [Planctomycetia bacterium]|nr:metallophosphoesterase family protein [Planctomycetia bacterium]